MSHFAVLVIGDNVNEQLVPYHEFECTGNNNQFVQDMDVTDEYRKDYDTKTERRFISPSGESFSPYDDQFYRDFTDEELESLKTENDGRLPINSSGQFRGQNYYISSWDDDKGYRPRFHFMPEGYREERQKMSENGTFIEFIEDWSGYTVVPFASEPNIENEHKYGYVLVDENGNVTKVVKRTNPNAKWDWWVEGGGWTGFFKLKENRIGGVGRPGLMTEAPKKGWVDIALKGDIDFEGMRDEAGNKAGELYDEVFAIIGHLPLMESWESVRNRIKDIDQARTEYHNQERAVALKNSKNRDFIWLDAEDFNVTREEYVNKARASATITFAIVKDGKWYERGEMGWWGVVSNEEDRDAWHQKYNELLDGLSDDTLLTLVDCHI